VGVPILTTWLNDQHTVPAAAFRCTTARPEPVGEPLGTSFFPSSLAETTGLIMVVLFELASAVTGTATAAAIAAAVNSRARIGSSSLDAPSPGIRADIGLRVP